MKKSIFVAIFMSFVFSGCATSVWEAKFGKDKPHISFVETPTGEVKDRLYVWNPNHNAAYIFEDNQRVAACVASADVAKTTNVDSSFKIDIGKILEKAEGVNIEKTLKIVENITKLNEKKESASFLNVAMFHICMMSGSNKITKEHANTLMFEAIKQSASLRKEK